MHTFRRALLALCLSTAMQPAPGAPAIAVVGNALHGPTALSRVAVERIFRRRQRIDRTGHVLVPVNLPPDHPLRQAVSQLLFHRPPEAMREYWNEQYFHGISPPAVLGSQEAVLRFVEHTPGAIGYVAACRVDRRVRVLVRLPVPPTLHAGYRSLCGDGHAPHRSGPADSLQLLHGDPAKVAGSAHPRLPPITPTP